MTARAAALASESAGNEVTRIRPRTAAASTAPGAASPLTLARGLLKSGSPEGALQILEAEISAGRESAELLRLVARSALQLGNQAQAQRALERAVTLAPDDVVSNIRLVRVLLRSQETAR